MSDTTEPADLQTMANTSEPLPDRPNPAPPATKVWDISELVPGDLVVRLSKDSKEGLLRVHKAVLLMVSPVFRAMLSGGFSEGTREKPFDETDSLFLEDDFDEFFIFSAILHNTTSRIPFPLYNLDWAPGVASVADKYQCASQVLKHYLGPLNASFSFEYMNRVNGLGNMTILDVICIAELAGDKRLLWRATRYAAAHYGEEAWKDMETDPRLEELVPKDLWEEVNNIRVRGFEKLSKQADYQVRHMLTRPGDRITTICTNASKAIAIHDLMMRKFLKTTEWKLAECSLIDAWKVCKRTAMRIQNDLQACSKHPTGDNDPEGCMKVAGDMDSFWRSHSNELPGVCFECVALKVEQRSERRCKHAKDF